MQHSFLEGGEWYPVEIVCILCRLLNNRLGILLEALRHERNTSIHTFRDTASIFMIAFQ